MHAGGSGKGAASMYSLLPPEDFLPFVIPFQGGSGMLAGELAAHKLWIQSLYAKDTKSHYQKDRPSEGGGEGLGSSMCGRAVQAAL